MTNEANRMRFIAYSRDAEIAMSKHSTCLGLSNTAALPTCAPPDESNRKLSALLRGVLVVLMVALMLVLFGGGLPVPARCKQLQQWPAAQGRRQRDKRAAQPAVR